MNTISKIATTCCYFSAIVGIINNNISMTIMFCSGAVIIVLADIADNLKSKS